MLNQNFQDPFVAIVIDPVRTISAGKVNLGAFRTYPKGKFIFRTSSFTLDDIKQTSLINILDFFPLKGYKPQDDGPSEYQTIPLSKIEDFGVHCKQYYSLEVSYFKSAMDKRLLDSLWNHYWVNTLSSSLLITNAEYTTGTLLILLLSMLGKYSILYRIEPSNQPSNPF